MKYAAVIFDLFGTLVDNFSQQEHESVLAEMASVLGAPPDDFIRLWFDTGDQRFLGTLQGPEGVIDHVCRQLGVCPADEDRRQASRIRFGLTRRYVVPRADAISVLSNLKAAGLLTALISDCSTETTVVWEGTAFAPLFDATVFSCSVGMKKPDPRIYLLATERLGIRPDECMYVADGVGRELEAAAEVGMQPVLIRAPDDDMPDLPRVEPDKWDGPRISSLTEVLTLLE